jgi:hypothetical protein
MKEKQHLERVTEGLKAIYGDKSDDLHVVERGATPLQRLVGTLLRLSVLLFVVVSLVTLVVLRQTWFAPLDPSVQVSAEWVTPLVTGSEATLEIRYANPLRQPLANVSIDFNPPPGFKIQTLLPAPTDPANFVWQIGSLGRSSDGLIKVTGLVTSAPGASFGAQVITIFRPANFNADFSQVANLTSTVESSVYSVEIAPVTAVLPGEVINYNFQVKGPADSLVGTPSHPLLLEVQVPPSFTVTGTTPESLTAGLRRIPIIFTDGQATVLVSGIYTADATGTQSWQSTLVEESPTGPLAHVQSSWATDVRADGIAVTIVGNGEEAQTEISRGKSLRLSVRLKNTGSSPLSATSLLLDFQPGTGVPINWTAATLDGGVITKDGIRYNISADLAPGEERIFNPSFPVRSEVRAGDQSQFSVTAKLSSGDRVTTTTPFNIILVDIPALTLEAEGVSGPLPPVVGQGTTYAVTAVIPATTGDLSALELTGILPAGVTFGGVTGGSWTPTYNASNRSLQLVASPKKSDQDLSVTFTLVAIPGSADQGAPLALWRDLIFRGQDLSGPATFSLSWPNLTVDGPLN